MKKKFYTLKQSRLIKLHLVKFKFYKQFNENVEFVELQLKKALRIIYNYHYYKKRILFIGLPESLQNQYLDKFQKTVHWFVPESTWISGTITNRASIFRSLHYNNTLRILLTIQRKPDLIVLFNKESETEAYQEAIKLKIPIIAITSLFNNDSEILYPICRSSQAVRKENNIYIHLLNSILKKDK